MNAGTRGGKAAPLVEHQVQGLSDPFDTQQSTLPVHLRMVESGLLSALRNPVGYSTGSVTLAGTKFNGANTGSAENDPANAAIALGWLDRQQRGGEGSAT